MHRNHLLVPLMLAAVASQPLSAAERDKSAIAFRPHLVKVELPASQVRPGGTLPIGFQFRNDGTQPAPAEYRVFVHCERTKTCGRENIVWGFDHDPIMPTTQWRPGEDVMDGSYSVPVPATAKPGKYWLHVGVYTGQNGSTRFSDQYTGPITVDPQAPPLLEQSRPMPADALARRRAALAIAPQQAATLESAKLRFSIDRATGRYEIVDKQSNVAWHSNPYQPRFGEATLLDGQNRQRVALSGPTIEQAGRSLKLSFATPLGKEPIRVQIDLLDDGATLQLSYTPKPEQIESLRLLDEALWVTDADAGYTLMPVREGMLIPADSGRLFRHRFGTYEYEGCHMAMFGLVKQGSTLLVHWDDPYIALELQSALVDSERIPGRQVLSATVLLRSDASRIRLQLLGKGDAVTIAQAYRCVAESRGLAETWAQKIARRPEAAKLIGASNVKLWSTLLRNLRNGGDGRATVNWTFDEAAQVAEHLHNDLKLDRVLFIIGGWIRRGYDNQHPDILPAAPECGGNEGLAAAARRIKAAGYTLGLHDNYQDIYRDSPSWDERLIMKNAKGELVKGGSWAGGQAWLTCSRQAVGLAKRSQNLPGVHALVGDAAYFIDTTYASGLQECHDREHPLTKRDDLRYKCDLSDYGRQVFGLFGSECGREWAIPHADFFEGLTGVSGRYYHDEKLLDTLGGTVVPLFEMVFRDCIALYGKYGYDCRNAASYVLHHVNIGRPLNYHSIPSHCYWKQAQPFVPDAGGKGSGRGCFVRGDGGWSEGMHPTDRFLKNTHEVLSPLHELTAQQRVTRHEFLTPDRRAQRTVFGADTVVTTNDRTEPLTIERRDGGKVILPAYGFLVESPRMVAFHATRWGTVEYSAPVLFVVRSLDGKPLVSSRQIHVFHGFGDMRLDLSGRVIEVKRESVVAQ